MEKIEKVKSKKYLSGGYYEIKRNGQEQPDAGDNIMVTATIFLPSDGPGPVHLRSDLRYGNRCEVAGEALYYFWGESVEGYRIRTKTFTSEKWLDAFQKASDYCDEELLKLDQMITARADALTNAE